MVKKVNKAKLGFTLIELLVVIAIIGVLASIVLASLNTARVKARDARRIADIKQIQLALELYADSSSGSGKYPIANSACAHTGSTARGLESITQTFIAQVPRDPQSNLAIPNCYLYASGQGTANTAFYHIAAALEDPTNNALGGDRDCISSSTTCFVGGATVEQGFDGQSGTTDGRFDLTN